jgi:hypothetical protein
MHKLTCATLEKAATAEKELAARRQIFIDRLFNNVCKVIAGNVIILNAWYRQISGYVEIIISENLYDFSCAGTHFLHMRYVSDENLSADPKYSDLSKCFIKFVMPDYAHESEINIKIPSKTVQAKHPQPSQEWTLMYEV